METIRTSGPRETEQAGAELAGDLSPGDVVLLSGGVGCGKTVFVRGACRALGVHGPVTSPTYTIGQRYDGPVPVSHIDLYRLESIDSEEPGVLDAYLDDGTIAFVEWPGDAEPELREITARVELVHSGGDAREIRIDRG